MRHVNSFPIVRLKTAKANTIYGSTFEANFPSAMQRGSPRNNFPAGPSNNIVNTVSASRNGVVYSVDCFPIARLKTGFTNTKHNSTFAPKLHSSTMTGSPSNHLPVRLATHSVCTVSSSSNSMLITGRTTVQMISPDPIDTSPTIANTSASPRTPVLKTAQLFSPKYKKLIRCGKKL